MPNLVHTPQLGRHLTSVIVTPLTVSDGGVPTAGTPVDVTARVVSLNATGSRTTEEISSVNSTNENQVTLMGGINFALSIFKTNGGGDPAPLRSLWMAATYCRVVWVEGTGTSQRTHTLFAKVRDNDSAFEGKGRQDNGLVLVPADFGANTYTIA